MTARDSNESSSGSKDNLPFDPQKWYTQPELLKALRIGKKRLQEWKKQGLKSVDELTPHWFWGGDVHEFLMKMRK